MHTLTKLIKVDKGLESLDEVVPEDNIAAQALLDRGLVSVEMSGMTSRIFLCATEQTIVEILQKK